MAGDCREDQEANGTELVESSMETTTMAATSPAMTMAAAAAAAGGLFPDSQESSNHVDCGGVSNGSVSSSSRNGGGSGHCRKRSLSLSARAGNHPGEENKSNGSSSSSNGALPSSSHRRLNPLSSGSASASAAGVPVWLTLRFRRVCQLCLAAPLAGLLVCLAVAVAFQFEHIQETACKVSEPVLFFHDDKSSSRHNEGKRNTRLPPAQLQWFPLIRGREKGKKTFLSLAVCIDVTAEKKDSEMREKESRLLAFLEFFFTVTVERRGIFKPPRQSLDNEIETGMGDL